ncbi:MAG: hypothetical protein KKE51_14165 [Gammaproteobacteria bacterium]|nr:hypothetical protein [Gammaproteobacteria bacterium]MBU1601853.1 hypothetical protein [Gammaproteobacteria bacterium]MBU2432225.1 hypothetical protein [Gammaproteobacteria bacterium]MBU2450382.1 hypothetical protein [Gammaproteobacteria bacterium]
MQIRQLQVACDQVQDRLLLRISSQDDEEYRIWLTRRFLRELWPHLSRLAGKQVAATPIVGEAPADEAVNFDQAFSEENATFPLGSTPLLCSELKVDTLNDGTFNLTFREGRERSFQLAVNADLLQTLCAMLRAGAEHAQWNLVLDGVPATSSTTPRSERLSRLH